MKNLFLFLIITSVITVFSSFRMNPIPSVEFDIKFTGTTSGIPTLIVNGSQVTSSTSTNYWSAYVDGPANFGIFNFVSNKCYTLKGIGGSQNLCVTFKPNYIPSIHHPTIEYNSGTRQFIIINSGSNCSLYVSNSICCIYKATSTSR